MPEQCVPSIFIWSYWVSFTHLLTKVNRTTRVPEVDLLEFTAVVDVVSHSGAPVLQFLNIGFAFSNLRHATGPQQK